MTNEHQDGEREALEWICKVAQNSLSLGHGSIRQDMKEVHSTALAALSCKDATRVPTKAQPVEVGAQRKFEDEARAKILEWASSSWETEKFVNGYIPSLTDLVHDLFGVYSTLTPPVTQALPLAQQALNDYEQGKRDQQAALARQKNAEFVAHIEGRKP